MLIKKLHQINDVLSNLIKITKEDIEFIKNAKHNELFNNIPQKEDLSEQFSELKTQIDEILVKRNKPLEKIFTNEEEKEFEKFKTLLNEFYEIHKYFAKLSFVVTNFYNVLTDKIKNKEKITYDNDSIPKSQLKIKA